MRSPASRRETRTGGRNPRRRDQAASTLERRDAARERFLDDDAANALVSRTPRSAEHDLGLLLKQTGLAQPTLVVVRSRALMSQLTVRRTPKLVRSALRA
jgi:hypothetical protein